MPAFSHRLHPVIRALRPRGRHMPFLFLAALAGLGGAFSALLFRYAFGYAWHQIDANSDGITAIARELSWPWRLVLPTVGGALGGAILDFGLHWIPRRGADDYLEAITIGDGGLGARQSLLKGLSSLCSIVTGASIGREGPMVQLAAMVGSVFGRFFKLPRNRLRLLVACGATAGITAAYNAPIAGVIFVVEIAMGSLAKETLGPLIVSSVVSNIVTRKFLGLNSVYSMPDFTMITGWEVFAYAGLGIVCGVAAPAFRWILDGARIVFQRVSGNLIINMTIGGFGVGLISIWEPDVWGNGYQVVDSILRNPWTWQALLAILVLKIIATALSSGSGTIGGVFTPTLFVGAALGALYGHILVGMSSLSNTVISGYVMVGMGAFLASVTYAPLMCILMIFEMTLSYKVILPLMLACVIGHDIAHRIRPASIYKQRNEKTGPHHRR